jgi:hypothetical protein
MVRIRELQNRFGFYWPLCAAIGLPVLLILFEASPLGLDFAFVMLGIPILLLVWAILGFWAGVVFIRQFGRVKWRQTLASATLPVSILFTILFFLSFIHFCNDAGDLLHFAFCRSTYLSEIQVKSPDGQPRLVVVNRGGMIWASRGYVYDEGDEVTLDPSLQSPAWKTRSQLTELSCGYFAQPIPGHFQVTRHWYLASFNC